MAGASDELRTRLQITVDRNVAERVGELAKLMDRSQSWLAAELLAATLEDRDSVLEWFALRIGMVFIDPIKGCVRPSGESVTIQSFVTPTTAARVETMAAGMNQSVAKTGGWLLENAVNDHGWIISFVKSEAGGRMFGIIAAVVDGWRKPDAVPQSATD